VKRALLVHGLSSGPRGWWRVRSWLEDAAWQTEAVALLGHGGRAPAVAYPLEAYVEDVLDATTRDLPYDLVIAHSLGGTIATVIAAEHPSWTRRLVLLDPVWYVPAEELRSVAADQASELLLTADSLSAAKPHWHPRDIEAKLASAAEADPEAVRRTFGDPVSWDVRDVARHIPVPTLVLGGDPAVYTMLQAADARNASAAAAAMEYRVVPGAGHSPHRDSPDATRALLFAWLDRQESMKRGADLDEITPR
jgi:pimeloyl-ACP methyl ester carboxylesterase